MWYHHTLLSRWSKANMLEDLEVFIAVEAEGGEAREECLTRS